MVGLCTNVSNIVSTTSANPTACSILDLQVLVNVHIPLHPTPTPLNPAWSRWCLAGVSLASWWCLGGISMVFGVSVVSWWCLGYLFAPSFTRLPHDLAWGYCRDIHFSLFLDAIQCSQTRKTQNEAETVKVSWSCGRSSEWMGTSVKESTSCLRSFLAMACYPAQKQ